MKITREKEELLNIIHTKEKFKVLSDCGTQYTALYHILLLKVLPFHLVVGNIELY